MWAQTAPPQSNYKASIIAAIAIYSHYYSHLQLSGYMIQPAITEASTSTYLSTYLFLHNISVALFLYIYLYVFN